MVREWSEVNSELFAEPVFEMLEAIDIKGIMLDRGGVGFAGFIEAWGCVGPVPVVNALGL